MAEDKRRKESTWLLQCLVADQPALELPCPQTSCRGDNQFLLVEISACIAQVSPLSFQTFFLSLFFLPNLIVKTFYFGTQYT